MELINQPFVQLTIYLGILIITSLLSRFDTGSILGFGTLTYSAWCLLATFAGISSQIDWIYYGYLLISFIIANAALWGAAHVANRIGTSCNGDGYMILIWPIMMTIVLLPLTVVIKLIWTWIAA